MQEATTLTMPTFGTPEADPAVRAAWKALLGRLINEGARLRFFPHRVMMFMLLACDASGAEHREFMQSASETFTEWRRLARGIGGDHALIEVDARLSPWLGEHMAAGSDRFAEVCGRFDGEAESLLASGTNVAEERSRITALARFVATDLLVCMNELVASFEAELADTALRTSGIVRQAAEERAETDASTSEARQLTDRLERVNARVQMVALNAQIEAARVGDTGKAFGTVAMEIKTLSAEIGALSAGIRSELSGR